MPKRISQKTKQLRRMGTGKGADYIPYITTSEFNSKGTTSVIKDWKTGRGVHCLSQGEALWYYILRWDDDNVDIREQYPLENKLTFEIAKESGFKHPQNQSHIMTTDFLVTKSDGTLHAYSVKLDRDLSERTIQLLCIEKLYWLSKNCKFTLLFKSDVNKIFSSNIRLMTEYYQSHMVFDKYSAIKHKVAIKEYIVDMESEILDNDMLDKLFKGYK